MSSASRPRPRARRGTVAAERSQWVSHHRPLRACSPFPRQRRHLHQRVERGRRRRAARRRPSRVDRDVLVRDPLVREGDPHAPARRAASSCGASRRRHLLRDAAEDGAARRRASRSRRCRSAFLRKGVEGLPWSMVSMILARRDTDTAAVDGDGDGARAEDAGGRRVLVMWPMRKEKCIEPRVGVADERAVVLGAEAEVDAAAAPGFAEVSSGVTATEARRPTPASAQKNPKPPRRLSGMRLQRHVVDQHHQPLHVRRRVAGGGRPRRVEDHRDPDSKSRPHAGSG